MTEIDRTEFLNPVFREQLRELYAELDRTRLVPRTPPDVRLAYSRYFQGFFLRVLRLKRQTSQKELAAFLEKPLPEVRDLEAGHSHLERRAFYRACLYLGSGSEVCRFLKKLEELEAPPR